jgi:co-chaperonin GroES (HSP10)
MKIFRPRGHAILVKIPPFEEKKTASGIIVAQTNAKGEFLSRDQLLHAQSRGIVVAVGSTAYFDKEEPWCGVGDEIKFNVNGAQAMSDEGWYGTNDIIDQTPASLRLIYDIDVRGVFENPANILGE